MYCTMVILPYSYEARALRCHAVFSSSAAKVELVAMQYQCLEWTSSDCPRVKPSLLLLRYYYSIFSCDLWGVVASVK